MVNFHNLYVKLRRVLAGEVCGLTPRDGTIVAGMFMLMVSIMHLIFESGHFRHYKNLPNPTPSDVEDSLFLKIIPFCIGSITLVCVNIVAIFLLLISVWKELFWGVGGYIIWIVCYEIGQLNLLIFTIPYHVELSNSVRALEWFGFSMRLISHFFWLTFMIVHTIELYKISRNNEDPSQSKKQVPPRLKFAKDLAV
ncbi:transmembrane protein 217-like [Heptranchias perlo]|uniref:transmembrane protein 217-like n=1 Tax=Heptranchias perlo TaxID=212740 RepID=UPI003559F32F